VSLYVVGSPYRRSFLSFLLPSPLPRFSADARDPNPPPSPQKLDKEQKRKLKKTLKELDTPYKQWLTRMCLHHFAEERRAFLQLDTNEEREQFIEQFWLRRSNNPDLFPTNDFKEEPLPSHRLCQ